MLFKACRKLTSMYTHTAHVNLFTASCDWSVASAGEGANNYIFLCFKRLYIYFGYSNDTLKYI